MPQPSESTASDNHDPGGRLRRHLAGDWVRDENHANLYSSGTAVPYSNDPFASKELPGIIASASDLSSTSPELEAYADAWPASYYLSPRRTSLVRGFQWPTDRPVLEVGAGCGTITRFLGETFDDVVAVEGHPDRARVAALRTRDLPGVTVATSDIDHLAVAEPFGIVFCVGVLEYSPTFTDDPEPALRFLSKLRGLMAEDAWLVLAIENQFGMKYLRGIPEDHTGRPFEGIHGYLRNDTARTWSRTALDRLLTDAGFASRHFSYPLPDYKFPEIVLSDAAARSPYAASLAAFTAGRKRAGSTPDPLANHSFDEAAATVQAAEAGLLPEVANSFLVFASPSADRGRGELQNWDALRYTYNHRRPELRATWRVDSVHDESPQVRRSLVDPQATGGSYPLTGSTRLTSQLPYDEPCLTHPTIATTLWAAVDVSREPLDTLIDQLRPWAEFIAQHVQNGGVDGELFDAVPGNLVGSDDGTCVVIDREYALDGPIRATTLLLRGLVPTLHDCPKSRVYPGITNERYWSLLQTIAGRLGTELSETDLEDYCRFEADLQRAVTGAATTSAPTATELRTRRVAFELRSLTMRDVRKLGPGNLTDIFVQRLRAKVR